MGWRMKDPKNAISIFTFFTELHVRVVHTLVAHKTGESLMMGKKGDESNG